MDISNIINILIVITLLGLTLGFLFYKKIVGASLLFIKLLFSIGLIIALSSLFTPSIYYSLVESNFSTTALATDIKSIDKTLTQVSKFQINVNNTLNGFFNTGYQENVEEYKSNVYGQIVDFITVGLRISLSVLSLILLMFAMYIRYLFAGSFEVRDLQRQINNLNKEVEELKKKSL